jgi:phosphoglycolate phosphatase
VVGDTETPKGDGVALTGFAGNSCLAVFDLDGTLVETQELVARAFCVACKACGIATPEPSFFQYILHLPTIVAVQRLLPGADYTAQLTLAFTYRDALRALRQASDYEETLIPGAVEALHAMSAAGWLLGLATNRSRQAAERLLREKGLFCRFATIQTASDQMVKPDPAFLHQAMTESGMTSASTVMIGDTVDDIAMARRAGVRAVGVAWGYTPPRYLLVAGADIILTSFSDMPVLLHTLIAPREVR